MTAPPRIGLVACDVFEEEIALHGGAGPHIVETRWLEMGLHDRPDELRESVQKAMDALDAREDVDAIALAYALCGRGAHGLRAGRRRVAIPRAHDCMAILLGSRERFARLHERAPDAFYFTPGWMRKGRSPGPRRLEILREELSKRFDPDDVEFLIGQEREEWARRSRAIFIDLGTPGADEKAAEAEGVARELGWKFERLAGDPALLRDLLEGRWDHDRFQILEPGQTLEHVVRDCIFSPLDQGRIRPCGVGGSPG